MRCARCPLFESWNNENDSGASCAIFGDGWDSRFQYEEGPLDTVVGCYIEKAYIDKVDKKIEKHHAKMVEQFLEDFKNENPVSL